VSAPELPLRPPVSRGPSFFSSRDGARILQVTCKMGTSDYYTETELRRATMRTVLRLPAATAEVCGDLQLFSFHECDDGVHTAVYDVTMDVLHFDAAASRVFCARRDASNLSAGANAAHLTAALEFRASFDHDAYAARSAAAGAAGAQERALATPRVGAAATKRSGARGEPLNPGEVLRLERAKRRAKATSKPKSGWK